MEPKEISKDRAKEVIDAFSRINELNKGRLSKLMPGADIKEPSERSGDGYILLIVLIIMGLFVFFGTDDPMTGMVIAVLLAMATLLFLGIKKVAEISGLIIVVPRDNNNPAIIARPWQKQNVRKAKKIVPLLMDDESFKDRFCKFMGESEEDALEFVKIVVAGAVATALTPTNNFVPDLFAWVIVIFMRKGINKICPKETQQSMYKIA